MEFVIRWSARLVVILISGLTVAAFCLAPNVDITVRVVGGLITALLGTFFSTLLWELSK